MNPKILNTILGKGIKLPKGEISLREISEAMSFGHRPTPELITLPATFIRSAGYLINETNKDNRERGFPLLSSTEHPLLIPKQKHWAIGNENQVGITLIHSDGYKSIGIYHTHPHDKDLGVKYSLHVSPTDIISFLKNPNLFYSIVGAPEGTFLMMLRTDKTPRQYLHPIDAMMGAKKNMPENVEQILNEIFQRNKTKYSGLFGTNWINFAMLEVKLKFALEFYCTEPRKDRNAPISTLLCKVDPNDGGFRSHKTTDS